MKAAEERSGDAAWITGIHAVAAALEEGRPLDQVWVQKGRRDRRV